MALYSLALVLFLAGSSYAKIAVCPSPYGPFVSAADGTLRGGRCSGNEVDFFLSIPYAKQPVRYQSSVPYAGKYSNRDATVAAPSCPQFGTTFVETGPQSEDCLFLDIWVPARKSRTSKLPVKVWLYGGGDETGGISNPMYSVSNNQVT